MDVRYRTVSIFFSDGMTVKMEIEMIAQLLMPKGFSQGPSSRVCTRFWTKNSSTFQGLSGTYFPFFKDSTNCKIKGCSVSHSSDCAELTHR